MAKNLAVTVNGSTIQKRNLKNVHYPNTSTNIKIVNRKIGTNSQREYWRKESILYNNGSTTESGSWNQAVGIYTRGLTFTFGNSGIVQSGGTNNNSFFGTLLYPSKKISVSKGDTISVDFTSTNSSNNIQIYIVDTNLGATAPWYTKCNVIFSSTLPDSFSSTWTVVDWVTEHTNVQLWRFGGTGNETSQKTIPNTKNGTIKTYTGTVPVSGDYYVALAITGYDSSYRYMKINNFKIE